MNMLSLEMALRGAGLVLVGLVAANFVAPRRLGYARNLASAEPFVRQVFYVHCAYIVAIIAALALLCLGWPELLLTNATGRALCGFFAIFWASRVVVQLTYYDRELRRRERPWDVFFLLVFLALGVVFALAALYQ